MGDDLHAEPHPTVIQNVNPSADNGFLGLTGWMKGLAQFSAVTIMFGLGSGVIVWTLQNDRADRREDRELFRDAIKTMNDEQNRRQGEVVAVMNYNSGRVQDLIAELRASRHAGTIKSDAVPKPIPPMGP